MPWNLFGSKETPEARKEREKDMMKQWMRNTKAEMRVIDRQIRRIEMEESKIKNEIKKYAKKGENNAVKTLVKEVCRSKAAVTKLHTTKAQLNSVVMEMNAMAAQAKVADSMALAGATMAKINQVIKVPEIRENMMEMQKEIMKAGLAQEMMDDAMEQIDDADMDTMAEKEVQGVLEELAIEGLEGLFAAPTANLPTGQRTAAKAKAAPTNTGPTKDEADIMAKLDAL